MSTCLPVANSPGARCSDNHELSWRGHESPWCRVPWRPTLPVFGPDGITAGRGGRNTLAPFDENPPDLIVGEDDIVFLDLGPVFEEG
jgi:hypothetical protein